MDIGGGEIGGTIGHVQDLMFSGRREEAFGPLGIDISGGEWRWIGQQAIY